MKRKTMFNLLMVLGLVLALGGSIVMAHRAQAQGPGPQEPVLSGAEGVLSPQDAVGTAFTYQGRLLDGVTPVDGTCDFRFNLYDDVWLTPNLVAGPVDRGSVTVSEGYFSTGIDFGASAFTGEGRQLEILVRCPAGSGSYTTLSGMVWLNPAPYAHSLRPGARISSDTAGELGAVLYVEDTYSGMFASAAFKGQSTNGTGVSGESLSSTGTGVEGKAASTGKGVRGETFSGYGVYGEATGSSGVIYGVYGKTNSPAGWAVYADGRAYVHDDMYVNGGMEVDGDLHALSSVEVDGDVTVHYDLTWDAKTGYVSVAAGAFHPMEDGYDFNNQGHSLWNVNSGSDFYVAPVQLPHGATVTKLTFYWWDGSWDDGGCGLYRIDLVGSEVSMAYIDTSGSAATSDSSETTTITQPTVDNSQYAYYLYWRLPDNLVAGYGVVIEYTFTEPY